MINRSRCGTLDPAVNSRLLWCCPHRAVLAAAQLRASCLPQASGSAPCSLRARSHPAEVDDGYHRTRVAADTRRDAKLTRLGYRVLRLEADLVRYDSRCATALVSLRASLSTSSI
jgi:hypothetical protein